MCGSHWRSVACISLQEKLANQLLGMQLANSLQAAVPSGSLALMLRLCSSWAAPASD